jgi:uncharacterized protein (DUF1778 family)
MPTKTERIEVRVTPEHKDLFERAAAALGQPLSGFAVTTLLERAREVLAHHHVTRLGIRDWRRFDEILDDDEVAPALREAVARARADDD